MLSDAELIAMRATMGSSFPDVCDAYRLAAGSDDADGFAVADSWTQTLTSVDCRMGPTTQTEGGEGGGVPVARGEYTLTVPDASDVAADDVVVIDGTVFEVVGVDAPRSFSVGVRVRCVLRPDQTVPVVAP